MSAPLKWQARALYKELRFLGREYPDPNYDFNGRLHRCFLAFSGADDEKIKAGIAKAEFIKKEILALYYVKKYRTLNARYLPPWER